MNINSLAKHHLDIQNDYNLQSSHITCFQKTKTKQAQKIVQYFDISKCKYILSNFN